MSDPKVQAQIGSVNAHVGLMAYASTAAMLVTRGGFAGSISPHARHLGMANIATWDGNGDLRDALSRYHQQYEMAGVTASNFWDSQGVDPAILAELGYYPAGRFPAISIDLEDLPHADLSGFNYRQTEDMSVVGKVNAERWGAGLERALVNTRRGPWISPFLIYVAPWRDGIGAVLVMVDQKAEDLADVTGMWLATHPDATGHRLGQSLFLAALYEARERGMRTGSGQASPDAVHIYEEMGFAQLPGNMWQVYERVLPEES